MPETVAIDRAEIRSDDPDQADAALAARFAGCRVQGHDDDRPFRFQLSRVDADDLRVDLLRHSMTVDARIDLLDHFMVGTVHRGRVLIRTFGEEARLEPGDCYVLPAGREPSCRWQDFGRTVIHVPLDAVEQLAEQLGAVPGTVRFESMQPVSGVMNQHWRALTQYVVRQLDAPDNTVPCLLAAEMTRVLAASLLAVFPNTTMTATSLRRPGSMAPAAVRRAMEFIEANAANPITTRDIARDARVSARALQAGFRRELDLTPQGYVQRVRLEAAHRDLVEAGPDDGSSVRGIAARWGFGSPSRFARMYRDRFGVLPNRTLRG